MRIMVSIVPYRKRVRAREVKGATTESSVVRRCYWMKPVLQNAMQNAMLDRDYRRKITRQHF